jgi:hypothetical protein
MALTVIKSSSTDFTANNVSITTLYSTSITGVKPPYVFDDISNYFDGDRNVFPLAVNQVSINTIVDSKDIQVVLNGQLLTSYVSEQRWPWQADFDSAKGYRVSGGNLIIYSTPDPGDTAVVILVNTSQNVQIRTYPYSANTVALGD